MGEHHGHRGRLSERYAGPGGEGMEDLDLLELLLCYSIPRRDVRPMAKSLLERFGGLAGIFDSNAAEIMEITGVGENSALLLGLTGSIRDLVRSRDTRTGARFTSRDALRFLSPRLRGISRESFGVVCLDGGGRYLSFKSVCDLDLSRGDRVIDITVNQAALSKADTVILAHALPCASPVRDLDYGFARAADAALASVGLLLLDYILLSPEEAVSLADRCYLPPRGGESRAAYRSLGRLTLPGPGL